MNFVSWEFLLFLFIILIIYFLLPSKLQKWSLLFFSIVFYLFYDRWAFLFVLLSAITAFGGARMLSCCKGKRCTRTAIVAITIIVNLGLLVSLKYLSWDIFEKFDIIIPLGISFYTLSIVGYVVDVYREKYVPEINFGKFLLYVSYFPHILQGPIARYDQLDPQFSEVHKFDYERVMHGIQLMIWGYIKKMVIADRVAIFVNAVYSEVDISAGTTLFVASILYTIQIYADFSGCVDIAMGISEIFGIQLINNFKQPYFSASINEFWRRWHISLSSWFRDYLYIPLGGNRKGIVRRWINLLIVFTVSGFWHGVGLNYIIWGLLHGIYQLIGYILTPLKTKVFKGIATEKNAISIIFTFLLVNFAWIYFRITDISEAFEVCRKIFVDITPWILTDGTLYNYGLSQKSWSVLLFFVIIMIIVDMLHSYNYSIREWIDKQCLVIRWGIYMTAIFSVLLLGVYGIGYDASSFIYMNF